MANPAVTTRTAWQEAQESKTMSKPSLNAPFLGGLRESPQVPGGHTALPAVASFLEAPSRLLLSAAPSASSHSCLGSSFPESFSLLPILTILKSFLAWALLTGRQDRRRQLLQLLPLVRGGRAQEAEVGAGQTRGAAEGGGWPPFRTAPARPHFRGLEAGLPCPSREEGPRLEM